MNKNLVIAAIGYYEFAVAMQISDVLKIFNAEFY